MNKDLVTEVEELRNTLDILKAELKDVKNSRSHDISNNTYSHHTQALKSIHDHESLAPSLFDIDSLTAIEICARADRLTNKGLVKASVEDYLKKLVREGKHGLADAIVKEFDCCHHELQIQHPLETS